MNPRRQFLLQNCCDNGPEYISKLLENWADKNHIQLVFIQPGNPQQNAYIEQYNRTVRYDWLNQFLFETIAEVPADLNVNNQKIKPFQDLSYTFLRK